jgi:hypothetical protein
LIDKKGSQQALGNEFTRMHKDLSDNDIEYIWFDFHHECRKMKWENLSKLVDNVKEQLEQYGHYQVEINGGFDNWEGLKAPGMINVLRTQRGVFRTNCMDCLDRTNVVQSVLSRNILHQQL